MRAILLLLLAMATGMTYATGHPVPPGAIEAPPLVYWAALGRTETVRKLLVEKANPNAVDAQGWSALQAAAENGHLEAVKLLVAAGADLNYSSLGYTALQGATKAKHGAVVKYLKSQGAK
jgi:ankyrin repeat protein